MPYFRIPLVDRKELKLGHNDNLAAEHSVEIDVKSEMMPLNT